MTNVTQFALDLNERSSQSLPMLLGKLAEKERHFEGIMRLLSQIISRRELTEANLYQGSSMSLEHVDKLDEWLAREAEYFGKAEILRYEAEQLREEIARRDHQFDDEVTIEKLLKSYQGNDLRPSNQHPFVGACRQLLAELDLKDASLFSLVLLVVGAEGPILKESLFKRCAEFQPKNTSWEKTISNYLTKLKNQNYITNSNRFWKLTGERDPTMEAGIQKLRSLQTQSVESEVIFD